MAKVYSFSLKGLAFGAAVENHPRYGKGLVFGRRSISLDRRQPATVIRGQLLAAAPNQVRPRNGQPFWTLAEGQGGSDALVAITTNTGYKKSTHGWFGRMVGSPQVLISDLMPTSQASVNKASAMLGLVWMKPGDVVEVSWSTGGPATVLFFNAEGQLTSAKKQDWQAGQAAVSTVETSLETMPVYTFAKANRTWALTEGVETVEIPGGRGLKLGPPANSKWRVQRHAVVGVAPGFPPMVTRAAISMSGENFVFTTSQKEEVGKVLLRTSDGEAHRGSPQVLTYGYMEHGTVNIDVSRDQLWLVSEGDVVKSCGHAMWVENGQLHAQPFNTWRLADAKRNPDAYIAEGWAPVGFVPAEWIGRVVETYDVNRQQDGDTYKLVSLRPGLLLDYGWDMNPPKRHEFFALDTVVWVKLRADLNPAYTWVQVGEREEVRLADPYFPVNERRPARVTTKRVVREYSSGTKTYAYTLAFIADAERVKITTFRKGDEEMEEVIVLGPTTKEVTVTVSPFRLESGRMGEIYGELMIHRQSHRKNPDSWHIHDEHVTDDELAAVQGQIGIENPTVVPTAKAVASAADNTPKMDFDIFMGKNRGRQESTVWVIDAEGTILDRREGAKTESFTNIPTTALVLRHQWSNYGYTYTEIFEVWYLPEKVTGAQLSAATKIAVDFERKYFSGKVATWNIGRVGQRVLQTPYRFEFGDTTTPVDINKGSDFVYRPVPKDPDAWEDEDHPVLLILEVRRK